jgi:hypothetical protein
LLISLHDWRSALPGRSGSIRGTPQVCQRPISTSPQACSKGRPGQRQGTGADGIRHDRGHKAEPATRPASAARAGRHRRYPLQQQAAAVMFAPCLLGCPGTSRQHPASSVTVTCVIADYPVENDTESTDLIAEQRTLNPRAPPQVNAIAVITAGPGCPCCAASRGRPFRTCSSGPRYPGPKPAIRPAGPLLDVDRQYPATSLGGGRRRTAGTPAPAGRSHACAPDSRRPVPRSPNRQTFGQSSS